MNILLLGGQSPGNQQWLNKLELAIDAHVPTANLRVHVYQFWTDSGELTDKALIARELETVQQEYKGQQFDAIVAKSFGAYVALATAKVLQPKKLVLLGLPMKFAVKYGIDLEQLLLENTVPTVVVNNTDDPQLPPHTAASLLEVPCVQDAFFRHQATHKYEDFAVYASLLADLHSAKQ